MSVQYLVLALRERKLSSGKTWKEMAEEIGISHSLLAKLVTGNTGNPTMSTAQKIEAFLSAKKKNQAA